MEKGLSATKVNPILILKLDILLLNENFQGMSYSGLISRWPNWLWLEDPAIYNGHDMLFLRGNINYGPIGDIKDASRFIDTRSYYDLTGKKGETLPQSTYHIRFGAKGPELTLTIQYRY